MGSEMCIRDRLKEVLWEPELRRASIRADIESTESVSRDSFSGRIENYADYDLIVRDNDNFFAASGIRSFKGYFQKAEADKENLYDVLEEIAVRRSRYFIKKELS